MTCPRRRVQGAQGEAGIRPRGQHRPVTVLGLTSPSARLEARVLLLAVTVTVVVVIMKAASSIQVTSFSEPFGSSCQPTRCPTTLKRREDISLKQGHAYR